MNILMFVYNPFTNDPRVYNEARSLVQAGHEVTVIAFDREKQNRQKETWDGIEAIRLRTRLSPTHIFGWPLWNGLILLLWQWQAYHQALLLHEEYNFNVIHCHDFDTLFAGVWLKRRLGLPLVYDAHEIFGYSMAKTFPSWIVKTLLWLEKRLIAKVDRIVTVSEALKKYFNSMTDKPVSVIMNCKPLQSREYQPPNNQGKFTIVYVGLLDKMRTLFQLIRVSNQLSDIHCIIGGIGKPGYVQSVKNECAKTQNITFLGRVALNEVLPMTARADCIFLMIDPRHPYAGIALGNKQFEAMVCGRPIICTKGTYSGDLTEKEKVGLTVEYTEEALKQAIVKLRDNRELRERLGKNALRAAITKYNWESQEKILFDVYENLKSYQS